MRCEMSEICNPHTVWKALRRSSRNLSSRQIRGMSPRRCLAVLVASPCDHDLFACCPGHVGICYDLLALLSLQSFWSHLQPGLWHSSNVTVPAAHLPRWKPAEDLQLLDDNQAGSQSFSGGSMGIPGICCICCTCQANTWYRACVRW